MILSHSRNGGQNQNLRTANKSSEKGQTSNVLEQQ